jgi:DNA-binding FadR family transcriptional regulator
MKRQQAGVALADAIEQEIRQARHPPGSVLAFENELQVRHNAGRAVVRQAVRILEQRGIAHMRRGNGGGLVIAQPKPEAASRALSIVIESQLADFADLAALIKITDDHLYLDCAAHLEREVCEGLRSLVQTLDRLSDAEFLRVGGHRQLQASLRKAFGEPAALLAHQTCMDWGIDLIPSEVNLAEERRRGEFWERSIQVVEALIAGDVPLLFELRSIQWRMFEGSWPDWRKMNRDQQRVVPKLQESEAPTVESSAERLAREILRDIRLREWQVGARLGGADELMKRYDASPNVLRQAIRMLEEYSAVQMQRGRSGGLLVAAPDPEVAVQRAVAYLGSTSMQPQNIYSYLTRLLLEALSRSGDANHAAALASFRTALDGAAAANSRAVRESHGELYLAIARLSGNAALQIFVRILTRCLPQAAYVRSAKTSVLPMLEDVYQSIAVRDVARARRAFLQYAQEVLR